ncbi:MAG: VCBS repeat-containing protein [Bacteroidetes bacterium]|nr:VCBS repeat-containing protein [Bacteroidota bacterium]
MKFIPFNFVIFFFFLSTNIYLFSNQLDQKIKVLLVADDFIGTSYTISDDQVKSIGEILHSYDWDLVLAGAKDTLIPCPWGKETMNQKASITELNINSLQVPVEYDGIIILPGRSFSNLTNNSSFLSYLKAANDEGIPIAAWCRGVSVLAAADILRDKTIIGNFNLNPLFGEAGADYIDYYVKTENQKRTFHDIIGPIKDGNIITTVRSLYYRGEMCSLIKNAIDSREKLKDIQLGISFSDSAVWKGENPYASTGVAWGDINNDSWNDVIVSNGIDSQPQPTIVYFNMEGVLDEKCGWESEYKLPSGNIFVSDLDNDNHTEIVVSHLGISKEGFTPGSHVVYKYGGTLGKNPGWKSPPANGFSCTGGDFDGDGDMDLVFGQGVNAIKAEDKKFQPAVIYGNENGNFSSTPLWSSEENYLTNDVCSVDIDNDGDLDLAISGKGYGISIFYNKDGILEKSPSWSTKSVIGARQMSFGDLDGDGFQELAVAVPAAKFLTEDGGIYIFKNVNGILEKEAFWKDETFHEPSCIAWVDADGDQDLDLAFGGFFARAGILENQSGKLSEEFKWSYKGDRSFWVQQLSFNDFDKDFIINDVEKFIGNGNNKVFTFNKKYLNSITEVVVNNKPLKKEEYCYDLNEGWISLKTPPSDKSKISVIYSYSRDLDLVITALYKTLLFENESYNFNSGGE